MKKLSQFIGFIGLFLLSSISYAAPEAYLMTVSGGFEIMESFGHTTIIIVNDPHSPPTRPRPEPVEGQPVQTLNLTRAWVYQFGWVSSGSVLGAPNAIDGFLTLFESRVTTFASRSPTQFNLDTLTPAYVYRGAEYLNDPEAGSRSVWINKLNLTEQQATAFAESLFESVHLGTYNYNNYTRNCTTGVRDILFSDSVLGATTREQLVNTPYTREENGTMVTPSLNALTIEALDLAISKSATHTITMMPPRFRRGARATDMMTILNMLGIPTDFTSGQQMYDSFATALEQVNENASVLGFLSSTPNISTRFPAAYRNFFFGPLQTSTPVSTYAATFLPIHLKTLLSNLVNTETGQKVIDTTREVRLDTQPRE